MAEQAGTGGTGERERVRPDDVTAAAGFSADTLRQVQDEDWSRPAGPLTWDCRYTLLHVCSDFFGYAGQVAGHPEDDYLPVDLKEEEGATVPRLLNAVAATGALLAAIVRVTPDEARGYHPYGVSDPEGFAAMGIVEALVHTYDIATGLGLDCAPPPDVCARTLHRLFPEAPRDADPWQALLWATGRAELPGFARRESWRWHGEPLKG
ncbi:MULTISPECIES: maleylpyruvate isomerase N-terminal domain-containing protein [Streptomyces]|uniref:Mycothiol-dependent maleylpyruvate isomerase metal-binding domain-containing protein n=1 Tax=Streptomyces lycii TaxID=2654337 RepID=A0ABQ7FBJ9_9ACTN|nr:MULTISPECIES: maleylpyruvate isomerase N-terminal domain-containing protein [Streptomyces]KAF4406346.1 hypothetical protein GCU69_25550 [Streptomyces lycii]